MVCLGRVQGQCTIEQKIPASVILVGRTAPLTMPVGDHLGRSDQAIDQQTANASSTHRQR